MYVLFDIDIRLFVKICFNFCSLSYKIDCVTEFPLINMENNNNNYITSFFFGFAAKRGASEETANKSTWTLTALACYSRKRVKKKKMRLYILIWQVHKQDVIIIVLW